MSAPGPRRSSTTTTKTNWQTPPGLIERLRKQFNFTIDVAASPENTITSAYLTGPCTKRDPEFKTCACGLCSSWAILGTDGYAWCNPPYGKGIDKWLGKAVYEQDWHSMGSVLLVPNATDTRWWAYAYTVASEVRLLEGRVGFLDPETGKPASSNTTGSTIFVFDPRNPAPRNVYLWDWK